MGICYQGKTLKKVVEEKERLFKETGYAYGLEKLELVESDPAKFMRFQMRASCCSCWRPRRGMLPPLHMGWLAISSLSPLWFAP